MWNIFRLGTAQWMKISRWRQLKKILVISDNHGYTHQLREVIDREMPFDLFLHCGDGECSKSEYERLLPPLMASIYLKGNCDFLPLRQAARFALDGVEIFAVHGHKHAVKQGCSVLEYEAGKQGAQLVCYGHTHRAEIHETDGMTFVNPGSFTGYHSPTRSTYAVVEIKDGQVLHAEIKHTEI